ncbi:MAG TPA: hypothetical protein VFR18_02010 [Terriglobia bacterium]|nr:hypothetical protein [Terriglobia bacterium]
MKATGPSQSPLLLLDVIDILDRSRVPYVIVGAIAAAYHGVVRASRDADAVVSLPSADIPALVQRLKVAGLEVEVRKGGSDDPIRQVLTLMDSHTNRVDLLWGVRGMEKGALDRGRNASFLGSTVRIIGPEDFIAMKLFAGSAKDLVDVQGVLEVSGKTLDLPLLRKVTRRYGVQETRRLASLLKKYIPMT